VGVGGWVDYTLGLDQGAVALSGGDGTMVGTARWWGMVGTGLGDAHHSLLGRFEIGIAEIRFFPGSISEF
jgi:hypothetical protein